VKPSLPVPEVLATEKQRGISDPLEAPSLSDNLRAPFGSTGHAAEHASLLAEPRVREPIAIVRTIMGLEIAAGVEKALGVRLSAMDLAIGPSIEQLAGTVLRAIAGMAGMASAERRVDAASRPKMTIRERIWLRWVSPTNLTKDNEGATS
jgi:hypothetical protein